MTTYTVTSTIGGKHTETVTADTWKWLSWVGYPFDNGVQFLTAPDASGQRYIVTQVFNVTEDPKVVK